ncbi:MAG: glycogen/starch/alpha-glucan phosphorylase, partial [Pseudomonas sp.]
MSQEPLVREAEVAAFRDAVLTKLTYAVGKDPDHAFDHDWFEAIALAARDHMVDHWMDHTRHIYRKGQKRVYYLSLEFLIGRLLYDSLSNLGLLDVAREAMSELGVDMERIRLLEPDAALGNGGLGRLAACFMESMSTLGIAGHGYGIRYEHGLFRQAIVDGWQQEQTERWLDFGNPWEFERAEVIYPIGFGGGVETVLDASGKSIQVWSPNETVRAVAYDTPVVGWRGASVNTLRLWRARAVEDLH